MKIYSLEEVTDEFLPKETPERELHDFKIDIVTKLKKILNGHKYVHTTEGKVHYFNRELKELIDKI